MAKRTFKIGNMKFVPESVKYNGKPAQIWTAWEFQKVNRAWVHVAKFSTPANETRANVFLRYSQIS